MNDYFFTEEHGLIRDLVSDFANTKLSPLTTKMDKEDYFPIELFYELGKLGFLAPTVSLDDGIEYTAHGVGADPGIEEVTVIEGTFISEE